MCLDMFPKHRGHLHFTSKRKSGHGDNAVIASEAAFMLDRMADR